MNIQQGLAQVVTGQDLSRDAMRGIMQQIMTGGATDAQIGALLAALRMKGETVDEITAAAEVMRELATRIEVSDPHLVDTCGTGGDGARLFNVSTASAFVVAAAGGKVAKHGNRSVSSSTGSADVLEAAGIALSLTPEQTARAIREVGVGFLFAPAHHGAMKHAIGPRREMGIRTLFNVLGPLTNPAGVKRQVIGVFSPELTRTLASVLQALGSEQVMVVHSDDGLDELSVDKPSTVTELRDGTLRDYRLDPAAYRLSDPAIAAKALEWLAVGSAEESLTLIRAALGDREAVASVGAERSLLAADMIALNAGAAIYVAGLVEGLAAGIESARDGIASGLALAKIEELASFTQVFAEGAD